MQQLATLDEEIDFRTGLCILRVHEQWWGKIRGTTGVVVPGAFSNGVLFGSVRSGSQRKFFLRHPEPTHRQTVAAAFKIIETLVH